MKWLIALCVAVGLVGIGVNIARAQVEKMSTLVLVAYISHQ